MQLLRKKFPNAPESFFTRQEAESLSALAASSSIRVVGAPVVLAGVRIRQDDKPLMNKLESSWFDYLTTTGTVKDLKAQALRFKLANGAWYKADMVGWVAGRMTAWECKGPSCMKNVDRGILTVKIAAHEWPEVDFYLIWRTKGQWNQQKVLP